MGVRVAAASAIVMAVLVTSAGTVAGQSRPARAKMFQVTVEITKASGKVLGSVSNNYNHKTCSRTACTFKVASGKTILFQETPASNAKFKDWTLNGAKAGTTNAFGTNVVRAIVVKANFTKKK